MPRSFCRKSTSADIEMCRATPLQPLAKPRSHDAAVNGVQGNNCCFLPDYMRYNHCDTLPPLANSRPHDAAPIEVEDRRCGPVMGDAAGMERGSVPATTLPVVTHYRNGDGWRRQSPKIQPPPTPSRWGHPESLLALLILTAVMLFLPLVLPQLPPPPIALLIIPLAIMAAALLVLVSLPSDFRATEAASSYV